MTLKVSSQINILDAWLRTSTIEDLKAAQVSLGFA